MSDLRVVTPKYVRCTCAANLKNPEQFAIDFQPSKLRVADSSSAGPANSQQLTTTGVQPCPGEPQYFECWWSLSGHQMSSGKATPATPDTTRTLRPFSRAAGGVG